MKSGELERAKLEKGNAKIKGPRVYTPICDGKCAELHERIGDAGVPACSVRGLVIGFRLKNIRPGSGDPSPRFLQRCDSKGDRSEESCKVGMLKGLKVWM